MNMSEDEILKHLSKPKSARPTPLARPRLAPRPAPKTESAGYKNFSATHLFCPKCKQAMPVKEKLLLFLADGDLYDYCCARCGTSTGTRKAGE
jgi:hypothetical protein